MNEHGLFMMVEDSISTVIHRPYCSRNEVKSEVWLEIPNMKCYIIP